MARELILDAVVFPQNRLRGLGTFPEIRFAGLFEQFLCA